MKTLLSTCLALVISPLATEAGLALREVPPEEKPLLLNGGFEQVVNGGPAGWKNRGSEILAEGRGGSSAIVCRNTTGTGWLGASQTVALNQATAEPIVIEGWSKALDVSGGSERDYSLYADLIYTDGTPLWGQVAKFCAETHDWEFRRMVIHPQKPVKEVQLHCLFRNHTGTVWFDDVSVCEIRPAAGSMIFQGASIIPVKGLAQPRAERLETGDNLELRFAGPTVVSLEAGRQLFADDEPAGFMVRDAAAASGFYSFEPDGACPNLGLELFMEARSRHDHIQVEGAISDTLEQDRAATLVFSIPAGGNGWFWGDDIRQTRVISGQGEFANHVAVPCGATGAQSRYPIAAVWDDRTGLAVGLDMGSPAVFRAGYHAGLKRLFVAFDFGLVPDTQQFPARADFKFVLFRFDARKGFRGAWEKYMQIFPGHFLVRSKEQGLWMPFTDVSEVPGWKDFGFRYHEGNNNVPWDDANGVLSFRYTEPMTWWMPMDDSSPRTVDESLSIRDDFATFGTGFHQSMAQLSYVSAMHDATGNPALVFRETPWSNGAVWSVNPNPWLQPESAGRSVALNGATVYWNPEIKESLYGPGAAGTLDGEYLDSLEGYVTAELNFRRSHFAATSVPLTFTHESKQPVLFKGLAAYEFTRWIAEDVHGMGKLMFANGVPNRFAYLCPWLDILGSETDWNKKGKYEPSPLATMDLWRTMSGGKPYVLLMNTDFNQFTPDLVEKYFQRALFYGMWPGFFSPSASSSVNPYWKNPQWFERDRPLFRKYIPLIERVAEAGWRPVPNARSSNAALMIERFGEADGNQLHLTFFNDSAEPQSGTVTLDTQALGVSRSVRPKVLLGPEPQQTGSGWKLALGSGQAAVWHLPAWRNQD